MTTFQIRELFYPGPHASRCTMRLKFLTTIGMIGRIEQVGLYSEGKKPYVYVPKREGLTLIAQAKRIDIEELIAQYDWDGTPLAPGHLFLPHILDIAEVNVQFTKVARIHGATLEKWVSDAMLSKKHTELIPDAYCKLIVGENTYHHFIEVDRATETEKILTKKINAYRAYMRPEANATSLYEQQYGTTKGRILFVASGMTRVQNIKAITEAARGRNRFWFTTLKQLQSADPFYDPIWYMAGNAETRCLIW
jgi:Replication-relaxation